MREEQDEARKVAYTSGQHPSQMPQRNDAQRNAYTPIHTEVYRFPLRHMTTSSTRSCSQNMGPLLLTNRRKFTVVMGMLRGSRVDTRLTPPLRMRAAASGVLGALAGIWSVEARRRDGMALYTSLEGESGCEEGEETEEGEERTDGDRACESLGSVVVVSFGKVGS